MKANGNDARRYNAKQLTAEVTPPSITINYEKLGRAATATEYETDIKFGHLKLTMYFRGKDRNDILRKASEFMSNFTKSCILEVDGYKGQYKGYMTGNDYEKMISRQRSQLTLEFDGYFYDTEIKVIFDGITSSTFRRIGSRKAPCIIEIYAKSSLTDYCISGLTEDDIKVEELEAGKTITIDGEKGLVTIDEDNAFDKVDLWQFPVVEKTDNTLTFSDKNARVTIRYLPMWL